MKRVQKPFRGDIPLQALRQAVAKVVEEHRLRRRSLAVWRDGKAVWVSVEQAPAMHEKPTTYRTKSHGV